MLSGDSGILQKATQSKEKSERAEIVENAKLDILAKITDKKGENITAAELEEILTASTYNTQGTLSNEENILERTLTSKDGNYEIPVSEIYNGSLKDVNTQLSEGVKLGEIYTDDMIGKKITYSVNGQTNWIIFGQDSNDNILITTEYPIENGFNLKGGSESWIKYESNTDTIYGLNYACSSYGKTIQGTQLVSRSIKMEDLNYVIGLHPKSITSGTNTYNIQSFDTYTFGTTGNWSNKLLNYYYPVLSGGTSGNGTGTGFWKKPSSENEQTFDENWYGYCWNGSNYYYSGADTQGNEISAETVGINTNNLKYIWGGNTSATCYSPYLVANHSIQDFKSEYFTLFHVASVQNFGVSTKGKTLCGSDFNAGSDWTDIGAIGIRPIVELPSNILVEEQAGATYELIN